MTSCQLEDNKTIVEVKKKITKVEEKIVKVEKKIVEFVNFICRLKRVVLYACVCVKMRVKRHRKSRSIIMQTANNDP